MLPLQVIGHHSRFASSGSLWRLALSARAAAAPLSRRSRGHFDASSDCAAGAALPRAPPGDVMLEGAPLGDRSPLSLHSSGSLWRLAPSARAAAAPLPRRSCGHFDASSDCAAGAAQPKAPPGDVMLDGAPSGDRSPLSLRFERFALEARAFGASSGCAAAAAQPRAPPGDIMLDGAPSGDRSPLSLRFGRFGL